MKTYFRRLLNGIGLGALAWIFRFSEINPTANDFSPTNGDSNLEKVDFDDTNLNYCQFKKVSLLAGYSTDCGITEPDFEERNSYAACAIIVDSQISKFNGSINLKGDFSFEDILKFLK